MTTVYIVQSGQTTWQREARIETAEGGPLTPEGVEQARQVARELSGRRLAAVYTPASEPEQQTAKLLAGGLQLRVRTRKHLREFDYGLWQGLLHDEIRRRQPKVFRRWRRDPGSVRPPGGETLLEAQQRIEKVLREIGRRHRHAAPIVVLRPMATSLVRCLLSREGIEEFWTRVDRDFRYEGFGLAPDDSARVRTAGS
ncbi:MAG: histidine phosphatase family protein [Phycisphaerae bacterium]|nr:histidine phosphatase family protein [Phycisphaerae bacterium]